MSTWDNLTVECVDYSDWQGNAAPPTPVVIIKSSEGLGTGGGSQAANKAAIAVAAGKLVLAGYNFDHPFVDGASEANVAVDAAPWAHVICLDAETNGVSDAHMAAFADQVAARGKGRTLGYISESIARTMTPGTAAKYDPWFPDYRDYTPSMNRPRPPIGPFNDYIGWQYTDKLAGQYDGSVFNADYITGAGQWNGLGINLPLDQNDQLVIISLLETFVAGQNGGPAVKMPDGNFFTIADRIQYAQDAILSAVGADEAKLEGLLKQALTTQTSGQPLDETKLAKDLAALLRGTL